MPSARTHDFITIVTAAAGVPAATSAGLPDMTPINVAVLAGAYLASGLLFSPDLDTPSTPYRRWRALRFLWIPYQKMVPHRSWVSHNVLFGPAIRVAYFAIMLALLALIGFSLLRLLVPVDPSGTLMSLFITTSAWIEAHPLTMIYAGAGLLLGALSHTLADVIFSAVKRTVRRIS